jgi:energy-coupling factor transporter ATP-binding protein EcfA2
VAKARPSSELEALSGPEIVDLVAELLERQGHVIRRTPPTQSGWDIVAYSEENSTVGVEIITGSHLLARITNQIGRFERFKPVDSVLLVTNHRVTAKARDRLTHHVGDRFEFSLWDLDYLRRLLEQHPSVGSVNLQPEFAQLERLRLENIRGFRKLTLEFGSNTAIIGRNGTGKSTILRAIAVALAPASDAAALLAYPVGTLVREGERQASIVAELLDNDGERREVSYTLSADASVGWRREADGFFVCGYGTGRNTTRGSQPASYSTRDAVASLFDYDSHLVDPELMLRRLQDYLGEGRYEPAMKGLRRVLGLSKRHHIELAKGGGVRISGPGIGKDIPLEGWADGYRMTFQWLLDFYGWAIQADALTDTGGVKGILLIDELEQHLHPSMQSTLMPSLHKILPETQVIATTHSPLVALGAEEATVIALHAEGSEVVQAQIPELTGYSAQDVLIEEALFGTDPYGPKTRRLLSEQRRLASIPKAARTERDRKRLGKLAAILGPADKPSQNDDPVLARLDELQAILEAEQAGE